MAPLAFVEKQVNEQSSDPGIEVRTYFVRERNALVARAEFSELYASLYLHQMDCGIRLSPECDAHLRDALAAMTLHCAGRPWKETYAWTVNFQTPLANIFVAGDNQAGTVIGNVFTENVKHCDSGIFFSDAAAAGDQPRRSVVDFHGSGFFSAVETFYRQSEQRPARFFQYDDEDIVLVSAQPDCDIPWLESLDTEAIRSLDKTAELSLLEERHYRFKCGCSQQRIMTLLGPVMLQQPNELFSGEEVIRVSCPRCGARHTVTREAMEAYIAETSSASKDK